MMRTCRHRRAWRSPSLLYTVGRPLLRKVGQQPSVRVKRRPVVWALPSILAEPRSSLDSSCPDRVAVCDGFLAGTVQ